MRAILLHDLIRVFALGISAVVYEMAIGGAVYCKHPFHTQQLLQITPYNSN